MTMVAKGLAGVVVDETAISDVRGDEGLLTYRGHSIDELVNEPFHRVASLMIHGALDDRLLDVLRDHAALSEGEAQRALALPSELHPMLVLQAMIPSLDTAPNLGFGEADQGMFVAAKLPAIIAARLTGNVTVTSADGYAERFLAAIGTPVTEDTIGAFNATQILQMEHSFNAGTFAARVIASTLAPIESAIAGAVGALYGPLHGGADEAVLNIVDGLSTPADAHSYVDQAWAAGEKIPGMGHREYRVRDPRALHLQRWAQELSVGSAHEQTYELLLAIESRFMEHMQAAGKTLYPNVEFYKGLVLRVLGLPNRYFTSAFAMARVFGYVAHFIESRQDNRIVRPQAHYVGP